MFGAGGADRDSKDYVAAMLDPSADSARSELMRLQRLLMPVSLPDIGCTEAAAAYRAHNSDLLLGGDWFDLIDRPESNTVAAVVGDVVGHGVEQISVMGQLRAASSALAHSMSRPHEIVTGVERFAETLEGAKFATLAVVVIDGSSKGRICSAGHLPPVRIATDGSIHRVLAGAGHRPPLGVGGCADDGSFDLEIDDVLVMYTDGVVERRGLDIDDQIGALGSFVQARRLEPCRDIASAIVNTFCNEPEDDQAVLVLRPLHPRGPGAVRIEPQPSSVDWASSGRLDSET